MNSRFLSVFLTMCAVCGAQALPAVKNVTLSHTSGTHTPAIITYTLEGGEAIVTAVIETNGVPLAGNETAGFAGDVFQKVEAGNRSMVWDASALWPDGLISNLSARVTAWALDAPPPYLVVDLSAGAAAGSGGYPVRYYPDLISLPEGGLSNDLYRTEHLLLRFIPASTFYMGSLQFEPYRLAASEALHRVTLTNSFYLALFETTQRQWELVMGSNPAGFKLEGETRPVENITYLSVREGSESATLNWPATGYQVGDDSFMGKLRDRTGLNGFDLPTEAQWEFACKAGSWQGISVFGGVPLTNATSDANLNLAGRYLGNGGRVSDYGSASMATIPVAHATAKVGSYLPNAWGFYDMHGNVFEWTLDYYSDNLGTLPVVEPVGAPSDWYRVIRGCSYYNKAEMFRSAYRRGCRAPEDETRWHTGFRVALIIR